MIGCMSIELRDIKRLCISSWSLLVAGDLTALFKSAMVLAWPPIMGVLIIAEAEMVG